MAATEHRLLLLPRDPVSTLLYNLVIELVIEVYFIGNKTAGVHDHSLRVPPQMVHFTVPKVSAEWV